MKNMDISKYQTVLKSNIPDLNITDFDEVSSELMDLLEKMLNEDQMIRPSLTEWNHHDVLLKKLYGSHEIGFNDPLEVQKRLKIFQGEMEMYSNIWGYYYWFVKMDKKYKKRIIKSLEKVVDADK